jgi:hypothetical protein
MQAPEYPPGYFRIKNVLVYSGDQDPFQRYFEHLERTLRCVYLNDIRSKNPAALEHQLLNPSLPQEKVKELTEKVKQCSARRNELSRYAFSTAMNDLSQVSDPKRMPLGIASVLASLLSRYGTFNCGRHLLAPDNPPHPTLTHQRPLIYCQVGFLLTAYFLGITPHSPDLSIFETLDDLYRRPDLSKEVEHDFFICASHLNIPAWIDALSKLNAHELPEIVKRLDAFRGAINKLLQNSAVLLPAVDRNRYLTLHDNLFCIIIESLLKVNKDPNMDLDSINQLLVLAYENVKDPLQWIAGHSPSSRLLNAMPRLEHACQRLMIIFLKHNEAQGNLDAQELRCSIQRSTWNDTKTEDLERMYTILNGVNPLSEEDKTLFGNVSLFMQEKRWMAYGQKYNFFNPISPPYYNQIYNYLRGYVELNDLPIAKENAREYLKWAKVFDLVLLLQNSTNEIRMQYIGGIRIKILHYGKVQFPRSTFEIRKKILQLCPDVTTIEGFILTRYQTEMQDQRHLENLSNWLPESAEHSQRAIDWQLTGARQLADRMSQTELKTKIIAGRGMSGSGKSTILERMVRAYFEANNLKDQILNPDNLKRLLKNERCLVLNPQIHEEASIYFKRLFRTIVEEQQRNFVLDKRLLTLKEVVAHVVEPAQRLHCTVTLIDLHVNLKTSINRLLVRPKLGAEPCPLLSDWIDAAVKITEHRSPIMQYVLKEKTITEYRLYATNQQRLVAHIVNGVFHTIQLNELTECLRIPQKWEIDNLLNRMIDDAYVTEAITDGDILESQKADLEIHRGRTVGEAYKMHAETHSEVSHARL